MSKCPHCCKFVRKDSVRCNDCTSVLHRQCIISPCGKLSQLILCKACKMKRRTIDKTIEQSSSPKSNSSEITNTNNDFISSKHIDNDNEKTLACEIRLLRSELLTVTREIVNFRQEVAMLNNTMLEFNSRLDKIDVRVSHLEKRYSDEQSVPTNSPSPSSEQLAEIKSIINANEQALLQNDVVIIGVEEEFNENTMQLLSSLSNEIGVVLQEQDVVSVERIGARRTDDGDGACAGGGKPRPRPLAVRLVRRDVRDRLLRAARAPRASASCATDTNTGRCRFYINERLTPTNHKLFKMAHERCKLNGWSYIWVRNGKIYVRFKPGSTAHRVRCEVDLQTITK